MPLLKKIIPSFLLAACITLGAPLYADAHAVFIFAWEEGGNICSKSYFSSDNPVRNGEVSVRNGAGQTLAEGSTNAEGRWCAPVSEFKGEKGDLVFSVKAGQGHKAEFTLPASGSGGESAARNETEAERKDETMAAAASSGGGLSEAAVRSIVREEMQAVLSAMQGHFAEEKFEKNIKMTDLVGGIGWIAGIFGCMAWYGSRRK